MSVIVTTATGTSEARVIKRYAAEVLVEITRHPAIDIRIGDRLVVTRQRVREA